MQTLYYFLKSSLKVQSLFYKNRKNEKRASVSLFRERDNCNILSKYGLQSAKNYDLFVF